MVSYRSCALKAVLLSGTALIASNAFVNNPPSFGVHTRLHETSTPFEIDERTGKRTGNSFLSDETKERAAKGNPIEKLKQGKDGTAAFVDVYEYARKIRAGEMEWSDVEKADLDNVSFLFLLNYIHIKHFLKSKIKFLTNASYKNSSTAYQICWNVAQKQAYSRTVHDAFEGS